MQYPKKKILHLIFFNTIIQTFRTPILFYYCNPPEAVYGYVNTCARHLYKHYTTDEGLHSSFVVFYFVFVLRLLPDVNHGVTTFFTSSYTNRTFQGILPLSFQYPVLR